MTTQQPLPPIEFIFDVGSPNAYLVFQPLYDLAHRHGTSVTLIPCLLGGIFKATNNQSPLYAFSGVKGKLAYDNLEMRRFADKHHLSKFHFSPHFPVNTLMAMRGLVAAQHLGVADAYVTAVMKAMWEDGLKMDDPAVFAQALDDAGLDSAAIGAKLQEQSIKDELIANTTTAVERGVFGAPTFFIGDEMFFGKERLGQMDELLTQLSGRNVA